MIFFIIVFVIIAYVAFSYSYACREDSSNVGKIKGIVIGIIFAILAFICLVVRISDSSSTSKWDNLSIAKENNLSDDEKAWYERNYGNGQYDKYQEAIKDYRGY